jgi:tetratricopeptide (TPR) repeat protein
VNALTNKGVSLDSLGRHEEAIVQFDKALRVNPDYANTCYNRALYKSMF